MYGQLQQKERDLILAAELGKALLEKNEELSKQNEKIAEDFSAKLEVTSSNIVYIHILHIDYGTRCGCCRIQV